MPRGPAGGQGGKPCHGPGGEFKLQLADAGFALLRGAPVGHHLTGIQRQLHRRTLQGDVPRHAVDLGAIGFHQRARHCLQRRHQPGPCGRACMQFGAGHEAGWGVAQQHVVLFAVQRALAQGLDGLYPLRSLAAQPQRNAARRQGCVGRVEIARLHADRRPPAPAHGRLHGGQPFGRDAEFEFDLHGADYVAGIRMANEKTLSAPR